MPYWYPKNNNLENMSYWYPKKIENMSYWYFFFKMKFREYAILVSFSKILKKMPYWYAKKVII